MRKRFILAGFCIISFLICISGYYNKARSNSSGAPTYETGSPYDGSNCTDCHGGHSAFTGRGTITTNIPTAGYTANTSYTITATLYSPALVRGGFELSPQDTTGTIAPLGTISAGSNTQSAIGGPTGWITHKSSSNTATNGTITWTMNWTAPVTGKGPVVFYAAFNRSNNNGSDSGDSIFISELKVYEDICGTVQETPGAISGNTSPCSGTSVTYSVAAVSGATSYTWTLPSGWTGTSTTNSITVTTGTSGGNITVKASSSCATSAASSQAVTITATTTPSVSITGSQSICAGSSASYTATPVSGGNSPSYQWQKNGSPVSGATQSSFSSSSLANGDVITVVMTSNASCVTTSTATSNSITLTVNAAVTPSVSIAANGGNSICAGQSVTITATPVNGGSSPGYQWQKNGSVINGATQSTFSSSNLANGDVITVVMTSDASCLTTSTATSNSITLTVTPVVAPLVSIASNGGNSICAGQSVTITATPVNGGSSPSYQWYKNGGSIGGATSSSYTTPSLVNNDSVWVVMTSNALCASPTTATSNHIVFNIVSNGTPSVSIHSNPSGSICAGTSITFSAAPVNGGSSPTYQWYKNGNLLSGATNYQFISTTLANNDSLYVVMTSNSACVSSNLATSNTLKVSVTSQVTPSVTIASGSGNTACGGTDVTFTATPVNGGTAPSYQWINNGSPVQGATNPAFSSSSLANGDVISVSMTSNNSCASPTSAASNTITMNIQSPVNPSVSVYSSLGNVICSGQSVTFTASPAYGGNTPSYQWYLNGSALQGDTGSTYASSSLANGAVISVQMTSSAQCLSQNPVTSYDTLTVSSGGPVAVTINSNSGTYVCEGAVVTFSASVTLGGAPTYHWAKNGATVGSNSATYITDTLATGDIITCSVTSSLSCASPNTATSNSLDMTVNAPPVVSISQAHDTLVASAGSSYQWYENNVPVNGAARQFYLPTASGSYSVIVTDVLGCSNTASYNYVTGIEGLSPGMNLKVYPNPVDETLFIEVGSLDVSDKLLLRLYDLNGKLLVEKEYMVSGNAVQGLSVQNIPGGVYLLRVSGGENTVYRKVVVGH